MTENLLLKLEEKVIVLLSEVETLRKEIQRLNHENAIFRKEREVHAGKLHDLIEMLDTLNGMEIPTIHSHVTVIKPMLEVENMA